MSNQMWFTVAAYFNHLPQAKAFVGANVHFMNMEMGEVLHLYSHLVFLAYRCL